MNLSFALAVLPYKAIKPYMEINCTLVCSLKSTPLYICYYQILDLNIHMGSEMELYDFILLFTELYSL